MLRITFAALLGALSLSACAQPPVPAAPAGATATATATPVAATGGSAAAETRVKAALLKLDPTFSPNYIGAAPFPGFREVVAGGQVLYVSDDGRYLMQTAPYDTETHAFAVSPGLLKYRRDLLATLPKKDRIVFSPANPKYTISVFTDIECGYCRKLHSEIAQLNALGIGVEYVAFPRMGLASQDFTDMVSVWCASDRRQALSAAKTGAEVPARQCTSPVAMQYNTGQKIGVTGTPAVFAPDGTQLGGYLPPQQLKAALDKLAGSGGTAAGGR